MESKYHNETAPDPIVQDCVDPQQIKFWLQDCEEKHGTRCSVSEHQSQAPLTELRLVDVVDHCIVNGQSNTRYFALSYMWGGVDQLQLTTQNSAELFSPKSLLQFWTNIPTVIQDAIQFVAALNERYLWVDSLCIVQDDARMKHHQISQMGGIYNGAVACLISVVGTNANSGLAGIRPHTRNPEQKKPQYQNIYLIDPGPDQYTSFRKPHDNTPYTKLESRLKPRQFDFDNRLLNSEYNSRAWTFQERLLSRRCIYFMENMVVFHCRSNIRGENKTTPYSQKTQDIRRLSLFKADPIFSRDPFHYHRTLGAIYTEVVTEYRRKRLTYTGDALNAFAGIGAALEKLCSWRLIAGLPEGLIEYAWLWYPIGSAQRRFHEPGNNVFPSWSWASWDVEIEYQNIHRKESNLEPYLGDMQSLIQNLIIYDSDGPRIFQSLVPPANSFKVDAKKEIKNWPKETRVINKPKNMLQFQALTIPFKNSAVVQSPVSIKPILSVRDQNRTKGVMLNILGAEGVLFGDQQDLLFINNPSSYDLVLLSIIKDIGEDFEELSSGNALLNVMLVRWTGDFAERVAVGQLNNNFLGIDIDWVGHFRRNWHASWKTIRLI